VPFPPEGEGSTVNVYSAPNRRDVNAIGRYNPANRNAARSLVFIIVEK